MTSEAGKDNVFAAPEVPRFLWWAALLVLPLSLVLLFVGAWTTGVSYDEPYHVLRLQHYLDHGWFLLADDLVDGAPGRWVHDTMVYSPVATLLLHGLNLLAGNDSPGVVSFSAEAYAVRHVGVALLSLPAVGAVVGLGRLLLGSWRWGIVGAATLVTIPLWTGHAMLNMKDAPVASGYSMATLALAMMVLRPRPRGVERYTVGLLLFLGVVLAAGTRPGIWPGLAASAGVAVLALLFLPGPGRARGRCVDVLIAFLGAWLALILVYPQVFLGVGWLLDSVFSSANYVGFTTNRLSLLGAVIRNMPLLLLVLGTVGLLVFLRRVPMKEWSSARGVVLVLILFQALLLPLMAALNGSGLHGLRQLLFAAPAVALLLVMGVARGFGSPAEAGTGQSSPPRVRALAGGLAAVAIIAPLLDQVRLFPFSHTYASVVLASPEMHMGTDQWRASVRELEPKVPKNMFIVCTPVSDPEGALLRHSIGGGRSFVERSRDCRTDDLSPLRPYRSPALDLVEEPVSTRFAAVVTEPPESEPTNCVSRGEVTRVRHFQDRLMSRVYVCDLVLLDYPESGVRFDGEMGGSQYLMGGWTGSPASRAVHLIDHRGDLGFAWPRGARPPSFRVDLGAVVTVPTQVLANNTVIGVLSPGLDEHSIDVRDLPVSELDSAGLVLTLRTMGEGEVSLSQVVVSGSGESR